MSFPEWTIPLTTRQCCSESQENTRLVLPEKRFFRGPLWVFLPYLSCSLRVGRALWVSGAGRTSGTWMALGQPLGPCALVGLHNCIMVLPCSLWVCCQGAGGGDLGQRKGGCQREGISDRGVIQHPLQERVPRAQGVRPVMLSDADDLRGSTFGTKSYLTSY